MSKQGTKSLMAMFAGLSMMLSEPFPGTGIYKRGGKIEEEPKKEKCLMCNNVAVRNGLCSKECFIALKEKQKSERRQLNETV